MKAGYILTNFPYETNEGETKFLKTSSFFLLDEINGPMLFDTGSPYDKETLILFLKNNYNLKPSDIKWIFITHLHPDHIGANNIFKNANLIISKQDYIFSNNIANVALTDGDLLSYLHNNCPGYINTFSKFESERMKNYIKKNWSDEKIGINLKPYYIEDSPNIPDNISIIPSYGHTFYHHSYLIKTDYFDILVTGDAVSMRLILRDDSDDRFLEPHMDFDLYFKSLKKIRKFKGLIVPGHDRPFFTNSYKAIRKNNFSLKDIKHFYNI